MTTDTTATDPLEGRLLVPVIETGEMLGLSRTRIYELVSSGALGSVRVGRRRMVPVDAIRSFIAALPDANVAA